MAAATRLWAVKIVRLYAGTDAAHRLVRTPVTLSHGDDNARGRATVPSMSLLSFSAGPEVVGRHLGDGDRTRGLVSDLPGLSAARNERLCGQVIHSPLESRAGSGRRLTQVPAVGRLVYKYRVRLTELPC